MNKMVAALIIILMLSMASGVPYMMKQIKY